MTRYALFLAVSGLAAAANLQLIVSNETIPAGATGQIKVWVASPAPIASGTFYASFDPAVFSEIVTAGAFGANGDMSAKVSIIGMAIGVSFSSISSPFTQLVEPIPAAGMGRLPDLPAFTFTVRMRPDAAPGTSVTMSLDVSPAPWKDAAGNTYSVSVTPGTITVGGNLAIGDVHPGGGLLPAGTVVQVTGTGFDPAASVAVDAVSLSASHFVSAQEIDFTLAAPAELTGKRVVVTNPDGSLSEFFPLLPGIAPDGTIYVFPLRTSESLVVARGSGLIQNPNVYPIDITQVDTIGPGTPGTSSKTTLAPGQTMSTSIPKMEIGLLTSSGPMRNINAGFQSNFGIAIYFLSGLRMDFAANAGSTRILSQTVPAYIQSAEPFDTPRISVTTQSGSNWLSASQAPIKDGIQVTINANPTGLAPGTYLGTITINVSGVASSGSASATVRLDVVDGAITQLFYYPVDITPTATLPSAPLSVDTNLFPSGVAVTFSTDGGGNWLSAAYDPAHSVINLTGNPSGLPSGLYTGVVTLKGSGNTQIVPVAIRVNGPGVLRTSAGSLYSSAVGAGGANPSLILVNITTPVTGLAASASTHTGGAWLHAALVSSSSVSVTLDATGLADGVYTGVVTLTSDVPGMTQIPVALQVNRGSGPRLTANPPSVNISAVAGQSIDGAAFSLDAGYMYYNFVPPSRQFVTSTSDGGTWLAVKTEDASDFVVNLDATNLAPGIYHGTISDPSQNLTIPVTATVYAPNPPVGPPAIGSIVNAASASIDAISPGELVTIYGLDLGPPAAAGLTLDANGNVSTAIQGAQVLFNGIPAPLTYVSRTQINAVVPYEVTGTQATVQVQYSVGGNSDPVYAPVLAATPGIFTLTGNGQGAGAILNEDSSVNTVDNRAARGSVIQIYGTGAGVTSPPVRTGSIVAGAAQSVIPIHVKIGGIDAQVLYAGAAPGEVSGVLQVNAIVPVSVAPGASIPVVLTTDSRTSPARATVAVK